MGFLDFLCKICYNLNIKGHCPNKWRLKNEKLQAVRGHQEAGRLQGGALPEHVECSGKVDLPSFAEGWV